MCVCVCVCVCVCPLVGIAEGETHKNVIESFQGFINTQLRLYIREKEIKKKREGGEAEEGN